MNTKQIAGLIVAAIVFVFVCGSSVLVQNMSSTDTPSASTDFMSYLNSETRLALPLDPYIGVIEVEGTIMNMGSSSLFYEVTYDHQKTLDTIDQYAQSESNKGLLLFVNSPGGGVYESDELYLKLQEYRAQTGRPVWTYMGSQACSGGYYISMASDRIFANRNAWTGSIGVIIGLSNYKDLMDKIGVETILFTSGPNKAMGNPGVEMTQEQADIMQSLVDEAYEQFIEIVSDGRGIPMDRIRQIADGRIYTAQQALTLDLIDGIQTYDETVYQFTQELGEDVTLFVPSTYTSSLSTLFSSVKQTLPRSDLEIMQEFLKTEGSGVPMYYASTGTH